MKRTVMGILAHVDAGKTTLSEGMLYCSGTIRSVGRVDHGDAFLDTFALERQRGITIFSKQAVLRMGDHSVTLLDTPGHMDFSAEMERALWVMDCAVLVISGPSGVQSHTRTLWKLLCERNIPTFIFVNKMDLPTEGGRDGVLNLLREKLSEGIFDYENMDGESVALSDETLLNEYLEQGELSDGSIKDAFLRGKIFPCWFGAALKLEGVEKFLADAEKLLPESEKKEDFGAKVFKISRDEQGNRVTHMKITGGSLKVRDTLRGDGWEEKVSRIRIYSGAKFTQVDEAFTGDIAAVTGLSDTVAGGALGAETECETPTLQPVLSYSVELPEGCDVHKTLGQLRQLEEEDPQLKLFWDEQKRIIRISLMGEVQTEILLKQIKDRFGLDVEFGAGDIIYRETIENTVEGVGHYEPLRHYAEVHLLLEPLERGAGLVFDTVCSEDELDRNWQRLILTHLYEKPHLGVLTGVPVTDMKISLAAGRAHDKHTEGGDFRQATYRAVRQGLMKARSVLLEPWYDFRLEVPQGNVGRAMTDLQRMGAQFDPPVTEGEFAVISGSAPVAAVRDYPREVTGYTKGLGAFACTFKGYERCGEQEKIVAEIGYDPEGDVDNTPDSVFCSHGAGHNVKWSEVEQNMHLPSILEKRAEPMERQAARYISQVATDKELMAIFERTYGPVRDKHKAMRPAERGEAAPSRPRPKNYEREYVLVDGYNIIFSWDDLRKLAEKSIDDARIRLVERLRNYQGFRQVPVIAVFDAYKVKNNPGSMEKAGDFTVVYTKEAETADMYIEKATYELSKSNRVRVATSDGLEQVIILGHGALRVSARAFEEEVREIENAIRGYLNKTI